MNRERTMGTAATPSEPIVYKDSRGKQKGGAARIPPRTKRQPHAPRSYLFTALGLLPSAHYLDGVRILLRNSSSSRTARPISAF